MVKHGLKLKFNKMSTYSIMAAFIINNDNVHEPYNCPFSEHIVSIP